MENWQEHFLAIMHACIPRKPLFGKDLPPWLSKPILQLIRKRNRYYRHAKQTNQSSDHAKYRQLRNTIITMIRFAKEQYYDSLDISDQKKFWKAYKLMNREVSTIPTLSDDSTEAYSDKQKLMF